MKSIRIAFAILMCLAVAHSAGAQNRRTKVRFNAPVEIPNPSAKGGTMVLPPGEYMFSLADTQTSHHVVRVTDVTGKKVHSMVMTIPDYRLNATSKTVMYLGERPAGSPPSIKSWFYPGDTSGERFIYPKVRATALAAEVKQPVPSVATPEAPVQIATPQRTEVAYDAKAFEQTDATDTAGVEGEAVQTATTGTLPKTGSSTYAVGLAGLLLLGAAMALRGSSLLASRS